MELMDLPDDALLLVLGYLDLEPRTLLNMRLVCRRLRDLVLHPQLWRTRRISDSDRTLCCSVMHLAPCVDILRLHDDSLGEMAAASECAARSLDLHLKDENFVSVLHRQASLGRLKKLKLSVGIDSTGEKFRVVVDAVERSSVTELTVFDYGESRTPPLPDKPVQPTLKKLAYIACGRCVHTWLDNLLQLHGTTLEVVHASEYFAQHPPSAARLGTLTKLRELHCPLLDDMRPLLQCPALTALTIKYHGTYVPANKFRSHLKHAAQLLRGATQLQELTLSHGVSPQDGWEMVGLLEAVSASGRSSLRSLRLKLRSLLDREENAPCPVTAALPGLPQLQVLDLSAAPTLYFLSHITPRCLPNLKELRLDKPLGCPHRWLHEDGMPLLARNPGLHLRFRTRVFRCEHYNESPTCRHCEQGCHPVTLAPHGAVHHIGLYLHPAEQTRTCGVPHPSVIASTTCLWVMV